MSRPLGEQAAIETLERFLRGDPVAEALLLFEDSDVGKRRAVVDQRVGLISTGDFLHELEAAGLIQSTEYILEQAAARGRNVDRQRQVGACRDARALTRATTATAGQPGALEATEQLRENWPALGSPNGLSVEEAISDQAAFSQLIIHGVAN